MSEPTDRQVAIVGAGVMGSGIAALVLGHGIPVVLVDVDNTTLSAARVRIEQQLRHAQLMGALPPGTAPGELTTSVSLADAADATAVIEAIVELPAEKAKVLAEVSAAVRPGTPVISNTSGIPIAELARSADRPEELLGTHFMNPSYLIRMVEVSRGPQTGDAAVAAVVELLSALNRKAVIVRDAPGFVTSRLLHPMINAAARIVGEGTATVEAVDELMEGCLGHPTGPLRTADLIGLDNLADSLQVLHERTGDPSCKPADLLLEKVRQGALGRKSGRGFYVY
ncbi:MULTISPECIES: 3-hydroxyacyl-CoA dehydrogenase family protein [Streptomyces]|uniref:3-hydroxyacyl-CoA dehydrogenase family protein n=1 Tax=Streptomyces TaxID=1883 RepID=UPI001587D067|nr:MULTISPECIES: 3-hydroxyacyl-CoA dehydrogenase family protein [Streptomyces]MCX4743063.1 3-hydroxyacyl-CoA dehydrogenase family protein [Streptomyces antibioticus]NUV64711.1 3-hydroxyacyl-CoA dehydrogenase family protein [Streptomyces sp. CAI-85]